MIVITAAGRLGRDAELRHTASGDAVLGFSLAVDKREKGEKVTVWIDCSVWGKRAEALAPHLTKGSAVTVVGEGGLRTYEKGGQTVPVLTCRVSELTMQGGKGERESTPQQKPASKSAPAEDFDDDSVPF